MPTARIRLVVALGALSCLVTRCSSLAPAGGALSVVAIPPALHLTNQTALPVYTFVIDRSTLALTDWAPCSDPNSCQSIAPGATPVLPYSGIAGYSAATREAIVYWWHLEPQGGGGFQPDSIRAVVTAL
jgi:hypothetical protein